MKRSLRLRLIVWIMALLLPASAAAGWLLVEAFGGRLLRDIDVALEEEAETVASVLERAPRAEGMQGLLDHVSAETDLGAGKRIVVTRGDRVVGESPPGARAILESSDPTLRVVSHRAGSAAGPLTVSIGVRATQALNAQRRLTALLAIGIPLSLLIVGGGLFVVIGRALRPLARAAEEIEKIGADALGTRLAVENSDDEVGRLLVMLNRMLERLENAVGELQRFTADAAHEIRTPLAVLRTTLDVTLARERSAAEYRDALHEAVASTDRVCRLAEDLLTLARLEAAAATPISTEVDLNEMLSELADAWRAPAGKRRVAIHVDADEGARVSGSPAHFYRLFNNLIENAVRHSPAGGTVGLRVHADGASWRVTVRDGGPGVAGDRLGRIFDRFYRADGETGGDGSGLGLSIAREIVRTYGGDIRAENLATGGFSISVRLPSGSPPGSRQPVA